jgi:hypothetical protein
MEADIMVDMSFFIRDLHQRIHRLHREQLPGYLGKPFPVYRCQEVSAKDFQRMRQSQNGIISFNSFFSTNTDPSVTEKFSSISMRQLDTVIVLFVITIDPAVSTTPYGNIREESATSKESEILYFMHRVFRIESIDSVPKKTGIYRVQLKLTSDNDRQMRCLTGCFKEEFEVTEG